MVIEIARFGYSSSVAGNTDSTGKVVLEYDADWNPTKLLVMKEGEYECLPTSYLFRNSVALTPLAYVRVHLTNEDPKLLSDVIQITYPKPDCFSPGPDITIVGPTDTTIVFAVRAQTKTITWSSWNSHSRQGPFDEEIVVSPRDTVDLDLIY